MTRRARLLVVAVIGFVVPNGVFLSWAVNDFTTLRAALTDRLALAFFIDLFATTALLALYFARHPPGRYRWPWFVGLSLLGTLWFGLAFYWWLNTRPPRSPEATS